MRNSALALVFSVTTFGWAQTSFDLMYIPSVTGSRVIRYDPINRVQLGGWAASSASSVLYNGGPRGVVRIAAGNYRTNMYSGINETPLGGVQYGSLSSDGSVAHGFSSSSFVALGINSLTNTVIALSGTAVPFAGTRLANDTILAFAQQGANLNIVSYNAAGILLSSLTVQSSVTRLTSSGAIITQDNLGGTWLRSMVRSSTGQHVLLSAQFNPVTGALTGSTLSGFYGSFSTTHTVSLARAHMGFYMIGSDSTTNTLTRFVSLDSLTNPVVTDTWTENFDTRNASNVYSVGMVVAPEPGTMVAMGVGAAALLRRRKTATHSD